MKIVPQRNRHDCGVAALATMLGITYETALETIGRDPAVPVSTAHLTMSQISSLCEQVSVPSDQPVHLGINELEMLHALWKYNDGHRRRLWTSFTFVVNTRHSPRLAGMWIQMMADQLATPTDQEVETMLHQNYGLMIVPSASTPAWTAAAPHEHWMVFIGEAAFDVSNPWKMEESVDTLLAAWVAGDAHAMIVGS